MYGKCVSCGQMNSIDIVHQCCSDCEPPPAPKVKVVEKLGEGK